MIQPEYEFGVAHYFQPLFSLYKIRFFYILYYAQFNDPASSDYCPHYFVLMDGVAAKLQYTQ